MKRVLLTCSVLAALGSSCSRDVNLPPPPEKGGVRGTLKLSDDTVGAGLEITLSPSDGDPLKATSAADGTFSFSQVTPGLYALRVASAANPPVFIELQRIVSVVAKLQKDLGVLTLTKLSVPSDKDGYLEGKVTIEMGVDPTGAEVQFLTGATMPQLRVASVTVGASGEFTQRLPPADYTIIATHPLYVATAPKAVTLPEKMRVTVMLPALAINPAIVKGRIFREVDLGAPRPAVGAIVTSDTALSSPTDAMGNFELRGLAGGRRMLVVTFPDHTDPIPERTVTLAGGETKTIPDFTLKIDRGDIQGVVQMADNSTLLDVTVSLDYSTGADGGTAPDGGVPYTATVAAGGSSTGTYVIRDVPVLNRYAVRAARTNYITATSAPVTVVKDKSVKADDLKLYRIQGDFIIDDGDSTNTPGFTRRPGVTLSLTGTTNPTEYRVAEGNPTLSGVAFRQFGATDAGTITSSNIPVTLSTGDGTKTLYLQYRDSLGNLSGILTGNIVLDTAAPVPSLVDALVLEDGKDFTRNNTMLLARVSASDPKGTADNVSGVGFVRLAATNALDSSGQLLAPRVGYAPNLAFTRPVTTDGAQVVFAQFIDNAGNSSALVSDQVVVDTLPPSGSMTISRGVKATVNGFTNTPLVELNFTTAAEPNMGYVQVKLANDNAADLAAAVQQQVKSKVSWPLDPTEGPHVVHYLLVDAAGNTAGQAQQSMTLDVTPPAGTLTRVSPSPTNSIAITLMVGANDTNGMSPTQALTLAEDLSFSSANTIGPSAMPTTNPVFMASAGDGTKTVYARYRDVAGNDFTASIALVLDQSPPTGFITLEGALADGTISSTLTANAAITVKAQVAGATEYFLGNDTVSACPTTGYTPLPSSSTITPHTITGTASPRQVKACLRDAAGNTLGPLTASIALDDTTPMNCTVTLAGRKVDGLAAPMGKTALRDITATMAGCSEPPAEILLTEGTPTCTAAAPNAWVPFTSPAVYTLTGADGPTTVRGCVRDAARNTSSIMPGTITLDTTPPAGASLSIDNGAPFVNAAQVATRMGNKATLQGTASNASEWAYSETNPPLPFVAFTGAAAMNVPFGGTGVRTMYAQFRDDVGNAGPVVQDTIEFDVAGPTGALGAGVPSITLTGTLADGSTTSQTLTASTLVDVQLIVEGATEYFLGNETTTSCPATGWLPLVDKTIKSVALTGGANPRVVTACFRDAAGNVAPLTSKTITLDNSLPTNCSITVNGVKRDGSAATGNRTALYLNQVSVAGCTETPALIALTETTPVCSPTVELEWQAFAATVPYTLGAGDGTKTVRGCVRDAAGNTTTVTMDTVDLDTQGPAPVSIVLDGDAPYVNASQVATRMGNKANVTGSGAGVTDWALSETNPPTVFTSYTGSVTNQPFAGAGVRTLFAIFRDDLQNPSAVVQDSIEFDVTGPTGALGVGSPSISLTGFLADGTTSQTLTASTSVDVQLIVEGATEYFLGNETTATCPATGWLPLVDKTIKSVPLTGTATPRMVTACFRDAAGNIAPLTSKVITLDNIPPTNCSITVNGVKRDGSAATGNRTALYLNQVSVGGCTETPTLIALTEATPVCSPTVALEWQSFAATVPYTLGAGDGTKTVRGCVRDAAGNTTTVTLDTVDLDTQGPAPVSIVLDGDAPYVNASQVATRMGNKANVTGSGAGVTDWALSETNPPTVFTSYTGSVTNQPFAGAGVRTLFAIFRDDLQNPSAVVQDSIEFDVTGPTGALGVGSPSISLTGFLADGTTSASLTANDYVTADLTVEGAAEYVLGNETMTSCPATGWLPLVDKSLTNQQLTGTAAPRVMGACFRDAAGNTAGPVQDTLVLDKTAPTSCAITVNGIKRDGNPASGNRTAVIDNKVTTAGCSEAITEIYLTEAAPTCVANVSLPWVPFSSPIDFQLGGAEGTHTVRGCVRDAARNVGSVTLDTIDLDFTGPTGAAIIINNDDRYINDSQVSAGVANVTILGSATSAFDWAVSDTPAPSNFLDFATNNPRTGAVGATTDGIRTIYAIFRDDLLNPTDVVLDTITVDRTPPAVTTMSIDVLSTGFPGYTPTEAVTVAVSGSNDAVDAYLAERLAAGGCGTADFASSPRQAVVSGYTMLLSPAEGQRRICLRYRDAAGNFSSILTDTILLDKTPPTTPQIVTPDQYKALPNQAQFLVTIASSSTDNFGLDYERLGGVDPSGAPITNWTKAAPDVGATGFIFRVANDGGEEGVRNELRLRAVDDAGNASGESVVFVTADTNTPDPINWRQSWVDQSNGRATAFWQASPSPDVVGHLVFYGPAETFADSDTAIYATEGASPVYFPTSAKPAATLSGLPNGTPTYLRIRPIDRAGNVGVWVAGDGGTVPLADGGAPPLKLQPDVVSPNELTLLGLPPGQELVHRLATNGNLLYVMASSSFCSGNTNYYLHVVDMKELMGPIQRGTVVNNQVVPSLASTLTLVGTKACDTPNVSNADLIVDGNWLYALSPNRLHLISLADPVFPALVSSIDISAVDPGANFHAQSMTLLGDKLAIGGNRGVGTGLFATVWALGELLDRNLATVPNSADSLGVLTMASQTPTASAVTRDRMIVFGYGATAIEYRINLAPTLAAAPGNPTYEGQGVGGPVIRSRPPVSGNLLYSASPFAGLTSWELAPVWTNAGPFTAVTSSAFYGSSQHDVAGHLVFQAEDPTRGLRVVDVSQPGTARGVGLQVPAGTNPSPTHVITWGDYAIMSIGNQLRFYEIATPRALSTLTSVPGSSYFPQVRGGFVFTGNARIFDVQSGDQPVLTSNLVAPCSLGATYYDEFEVDGRGDGFTVRSLEAILDRDTFGFPGGYSVAPLPGSNRVTDVELWGNHLVVAEVRASGVWLEVFDARKIRNRSGLSMSTADTVGAIQVTTTFAPGTATSLVADISITGGRVAVGLDVNEGAAVVAPTPGPTLYFVELAGLFDDDAATVGGPVHGPVTSYPVRQVVIQGNFAYAATSSGVRILNIAPVMDNSSATMLGASPPTFSLLPGNYFDGVFVNGSMMLLAPGYSASIQAFPQGIYSVDVSTPLAPEIQGFFPRNGDSAACFTPADVAVGGRRIRTRITGTANRAYYTTASGTLQVLNLE